jgi:predicted PP-loop superfamily ATPase
MIVTKKYTRQLVRDEKAEITMCDGNPVIVIHEGRRYQHVTRLDIQRVDHYLLPD